MRGGRLSFILCLTGSTSLAMFVICIYSSAISQPSHTSLNYGEDHVFSTNLDKHLPICEYNVNGSKPVTVNKTVPTWTELEQRFTMLQNGGHYRPTDCQATQTIAIIIPYRNREEHLKLFLQHMHPYLQAQRLQYTFYVVELEGGGLFAKSILMNAAFKQINNSTSTKCFIFHDVDMLPLDAMISYTCKTNVVKHQAAYVRQFQFKLPYKSYIGGVLIFPVDIYRRVNGFSNLYLGWGGEDDDMFLRINSTGTPIERPVSNKLRYESWSHIHELELLNRKTLLGEAVKRMRTEGLNSVKYQILKIERKALYTWLYVSANRTEWAYRAEKPLYGKFKSYMYNTLVPGSP